MPTESPSMFASELRRLLEDTDRFDRAGWCQFLGVTSPAISQWLSDETIPRADVLRMIVDELERTTGSEHVKSEPLQRFKHLCDLPSVVVSPINGARLGPTPGHYLLKPLRENFLDMLGALPTRDQELILREALGIVGRAFAQGADFARSAQMRDLREHYPPGTQLRAHDLVEFFGGRRWHNVTVIGENPLELVTQPLPRDPGTPQHHGSNRPLTVSKDLVSALVRNQVWSRRGDSGPGSFTYVLPTNHDSALVEHVQRLFWGPPGYAPEAVDLTPYIFTIPPSTVADILQLGSFQGHLPVLVVLCDVGDAVDGFAYAWFTEESEEYGVVLEYDRIRALASKLVCLSKIHKRQEVRSPNAA